MVVHFILRVALHKGYMNFNVYIFSFFTHSDETSFIGILSHKGPNNVDKAVLVHSQPLARNFVTKELIIVVNTSRDFLSCYQR